MFSVPAVISISVTLHEADVIVGHQGQVSRDVREAMI